MLFSDWTREQKLMSDELIKRGKIRHILAGKQREFYDLIQEKFPENNEFFLYSSRKVGKTFLLCLLALEHCWSAPHRIVRHVFPTFKLAKETVYAIMGELYGLIPASRRPVLRRSEGAWFFPNGSQYRLGGADPGSIDNNRGPFCTMILGDEMCFWDSKVYIELLESALMPQTTNVTNPIFIYASTPPYSPDHPSLLLTMPKIQATGCYLHATIYDNPMISPEKIEKIIEKYGGKDSNRFRREYMAELVTDATKRVVPEFNRELHVVEELPPAINEFDLSEIYNGYRVGDYGVGEQDLTGILGAVFDHNAQQIVVCSEKLLFKPVIDEFVKSWNEVEEELKDCKEITSVLDAFQQLKVTLRRQNGLDFLNPRKGKVAEQIAFVRQCFESDKIRIHSSCKKLIQQLESGIWKENNKEFERSDTLGHLDLLVCLVYMVRRINWKDRPDQERININLGSLTTNAATIKQGPSFSNFRHSSNLSRSSRT